MKTVEASRRNDRTICRPGLRVRRRSGTATSPSSAIIPASWPRKRIHTICAIGRLVAEPRYLAVVSRHANSPKVRHIRPMATTGLVAV